MKKRISKKLLLFIILLSFISIVILLSKSSIFIKSVANSTNSLVSKYSYVETISNSKCFDGKVSDDFNKIYESPHNYSFNYPDYFTLRKNSERNEDQYNHSIQYVDVSLSHIQDPFVSINFNANQNTKFDPIDKTSTNNYRLPCNLLSNADYRNSKGTSLTGSILYFTNIEILYPQNLSKYTYIDVNCSDDQQSHICNLIMPQILSTLKIK